MEILRPEISVNILLLILFLVNVEASPENGQISNPANITWPMVNQMIKMFIDSIVISNMRNILKFSSSANLSKKCEEATLETLLSIRRSDGWAVRMSDATGKIPSGILDGTVLDFGSYDGCLSIRANTSDDDLSRHFRGQYCMVGFKTPLLSSMKTKGESGKTYVETFGNPPEWMNEIIKEGDGFLKDVSFWFGICLPSHCSKKELKRSANILSGPFGFTAEVADCQIDEPIQWNVYETTAMSILGFIVLMVLIGTSVDVGKRLILTKDAHSNKRRLLGVPHSFGGRLLPAVIENFTIPVGSFFFMSGFLVTYTNWENLAKSGGKMNIPKFIFHKYWRMTPALGVTMILFFILPLIDSGPLWNTTLDPPMEACYNSWWLNFLYIQNWWNEEKMCLIHTWYLAALMQFHVVGALMMLLVCRRPVIGGIVGLIILTACSVLTGLQTLWNDFPMPAPGTVKDLSVISKYTSVIYIKPHAHIAEYLVGMTFGYLILKHKDVKVRPMLQFIGWILAILCNLCAVYGISGSSHSVAFRAVYISLHKLGWTLGLGWLTFACATGIGGIVFRILSWKAFGPLGQLGYLAYLLHPLAIWYRAASRRERVYYGHTEMVYTFLAHTAVSFLLSYVCYVAVEKPFVILETIAFPRSKSKAVHNHLPISTKDSSEVATLGVKSYIVS